MAARRVAVAASGGRDSTALLHCTVRQAAETDVQVVALHVHHGLLPQADQWLQQVQKQARRWGAEFAAVRLQTKPAAGESIEAWARRERYRALAQMAQAAGCGAVLLAHHRRDQAETWLLQALRGAGHAGLSGMPVQAQRAGLTWCRPWLQQPREAIEAYVRRHRLQFVDDSSNADTRYARNRLRQQVWPALTGAFADAEVALVAAATQAQQAQVLAAEVAAADLLAIATRSIDAGAAPGLLVPAWLQLSVARRANALRFWLRQVLGQGAPETLVQRLLQEVAPPPAAALRGNLRWPAPNAEVRLHKGVLTVMPAASAAARRLSAGGAAETAAAPPQPLCMDLSQPGLWPVPAWRGCFEVKTVAEPGAGRCAERGAAPALLRQVWLRARAGGERFAAHPAAVPRSLKKQYQSADVPAWQRLGPLVWTADERLLFVPALGMNAACQAPPGEVQVHVHWVPDAD